ncbi:hypothetical protein AQV86_05790 [Nanohaloarchaea archaeon SG9]|nr:hypothetical protein AQV86_05790 [Nanohaloarchaea archaeon SG9]
MTQRKGLSQILYLIIAASVLMMVALSLIFMFNDSVSGSTGDTQACNTAVETQCSVAGANNIPPPPNCVTEDGQGNKQLINGLSYQHTGEFGGSGEDAKVIVCPGNSANN